MISESSNTTAPQFELGTVVATPGALDALEASGQSPAEFLKRHLQLEQGVLDSEDHELNAESVKDGSRILSAYKTTNGVKIWIITEAEDGNGQRRKFSTPPHSELLAYCVLQNDDQLQPDRPVRSLCR